MGRTSRRDPSHARWRPPTPGWAICKPHTPVRQRCGQRPPAQLSGGSSRQPGRCGHLPAVTPAVAPAVRSPGALGARGERSGSRRCALRRQAARPKASTAAPRAGCDFDPGSRRARERIDRDREEACLSFCQKVGEALRTLCSSLGRGLGFLDWCHSPLGSSV